MMQRTANELVPASRSLRTVVSLSLFRSLARIQLALRRTHTRNNNNFIPSYINKLANNDKNNKTRWLTTHVIDQTRAHNGPVRRGLYFCFLKMITAAATFWKPPSSSAGRRRPLTPPSHSHGIPSTLACACVRAIKNTGTCVCVRVNAASGLSVLRARALTPGSTNSVHRSNGHPRTRGPPLPHRLYIILQHNISHHRRHSSTSQNAMWCTPRIKLRFFPMIIVFIVI